MAFEVNDLNSKLFNSVGVSANNVANTKVEKKPDGSVFTTYVDNNNKPVATQYEDGNNIGFCKETGDKNDPNRCVNISAYTVKNGMQLDTLSDKGRINNFIANQLPQAEEGTQINSYSSVKNRMLLNDTVRSLDFYRSNSPYPLDQQPQTGTMLDAKF